MEPLRTAPSHSLDSHKTMRTWRWILLDVSWTTLRYASLFARKTLFIRAITPLWLMPVCLYYRPKWSTLVPGRLSLWGPRGSWWSEAAVWCRDTGTTLREPVKLSPRTAGTGLGKRLVCAMYTEDTKACYFNRVWCQIIYDFFLLHSDTASLNSLGYLRIEGRMKDLIIRGGENIYPAEIEQFLYTHSKVKEVQVRLTTTRGQQRSDTLSQQLKAKHWSHTCCLSECWT